jgi:dCMP deaminase
MLINAGIRRIVFHEGYPDTLSEQMIDDAGIEMVKFDENDLKERVGE